MANMSKNTPIPFFKTLSVRMLVFFCSIYALIALVLVSGRIYYDYHQAKEDLLHEMHQTGDALVRTVTDGVFFKNQTMIQSALLGVQANRSIGGMQIQTTGFGVFFSGDGDNIAQTIAEKHPDVTFQTSEDNYGFAKAGAYYIVNKALSPTSNTPPSESLGRVTLYSRANILEERVWEGVRFTLFSAALNALIFIVLFLILTRRFFTLPLAKLASAAEQITPDNLATIRSGVHFKGLNELNLLEDSFNAMIVRLRESQAALRQAEKKYRSIFENAAEGIFQISPDGRILDVNQTEADILGYDSPEQMITESGDVRSTFYVNPKRRDDFMNELSEHGRVKEFEVELVRRDGQRIWGALNARNVYDDAGNMLYTEGTLNDITARKHAEKALRQAKEAAEEATKLKSSFLTMVSHELRTPLTSVLGFTKLIQRMLNTRILPVLKDQAPDVGKTVRRMNENIDVVLAEGDRLTVLINDLLDLSRLEAGKMDFSMGEMHIADAISRALAPAEVLAAKKGLQLGKSIEADLPPVHGDIERIIQVIVNLVSNAVKFTDQGAVICRAQRQETRIMVSVEDTGSGIPPDECKAIFEEFKQLGDTLTGKPLGSGLGLAICRQIVEQHHGDIWVESQVGRGSTFCFTLPL